MTGQPTCAQRIGQHLEGRLEDFRDLATVSDGAWQDERSPDVTDAAERLDLEDATDLQDAVYERIAEYPLAISTLRVHKVDLSTGGPADWLEVFVDLDGDITRIVYHFADWFDHAERTLDGPEFDAVERFVVALIPEL